MLVFHLAVRVMDAEQISRAGLSVLETEQLIVLYLWSYKYDHSWICSRENEKTEEVWIMWKVNKSHQLLQALTDQLHTMEQQFLGL